MNAPRPPEGEKLRSRKDLDKAIYDAVEAKTQELKARYGQMPEMKAALETTIGRINDLESDFLHGGKIDEMLARDPTANFDNVLGIFNSKLNLRALEVINAAENPRSGVERDDLAARKDGTRRDLLGGATGDSLRKAS